MISWKLGNCGLSVAEGYIERLDRIKYRGGYYLLLSENRYIIRSKPSKQKTVELPGLEHSELNEESKLEAWKTKQFSTESENTKPVSWRGVTRMTCLL